MYDYIGETNKIHKRTEKGLELIEQKKIQNISFQGCYLNQYEIKEVCRWLISPQCWITNLNMINHAISRKKSAELWNDALSSNTSLSVLDFSGSCIEDKILHIFCGFLKVNTTLKTIKFRDLEFVGGLNKIFDAMSYNSSITELNISSNAIDRKIATQLNKMLMTKNNFLKLIMNKCKLNECIDVLIDGLKNNKELIKLRLEDNDIKEINMKKLSDCFMSLSNLKILYIGWNQFSTQEGYRYFCRQFKFLINLEKLSIKETMKNHDLCILTESLKACQNLRKLDISKNCIDSGFDHLKALFESNRKLVSLNINDNYFSFEGMKQLRDCLYSNTTLKELNLDCCSFEKDSSFLKDLITFNNSLTSLSFFYSIHDGKEMSDIFECLKYNHSLTELNCNNPIFIESPSSDYLKECLKKNDTLTCVSIWDDRLQNNINPLLNCNIQWNHTNHKKLTFAPFQDAVRTFLFCLKINQKQTKLKIPKFVLFEIIKKINRKSFLDLEIAIVEDDQTDSQNNSQRTHEKRKIDDCKITDDQHQNKKQK